MALTAFTSRLGSGQGRVVAVPTSEQSAVDHVFVLGELEEGRFFELRAGDYVEVTQETDLNGVHFVRTALRLRVPVSLPAGYAWEASLVVDGVKLARATARPGRARVLSDLAASVSKLSGVHRIGVRLELVGA